MRLWPFRRRVLPVAEAEPGDGMAHLAEALRRAVEDLLVVDQQGTRGAAVLFGGRLLVRPDRALDLLERRLAPYGYTPFLSASQGLTWVQAIPLARVAERSRPAVNLALFVLTLASTLLAGAFVAGSVPWLTFDPAREPWRLLDGLPFALTLVGILGTHEFGHYFTARAWGASVSLPYFIPAPPPLFLFGTLGAVIRMRSPARDRNALMDIAAAGPIAGLLVALPALWLGLGWSRVAAVPPGGAMAFGDSLLMRAMVYFMFGRIPEGMDVFVHPVALAGWVGLFVTALNLIPVGQLDGGRIAYALFGARHRQVSLGALAALLVLGLVSGSPNWLVFAAFVLLLIGTHHAPPLDDLTPLTPGRRALGVVCLVLLVLLIPPVPIQIT